MRLPAKQALTVLTVAIIGVLGVVPAAADPPVVPPTIQIPSIFCFRITDIQRVSGDAEGDRFLFQFEVLNWTGTEAFDLRFALNTGVGFLGVSQSAPFFAGASVDSNGRPQTPGDDNANFPPADGTSGTKTGQTNNWTVTAQTSSAVAWQEPTSTPGNGLAQRDLLAQSTTALACDLVPGCSLDSSGNPVVANIETVDNGASGVDGGVDNVLDGFVIDVDDFDVGEMLSFNWFLTDASANAIGVAGSGNQFGFGTFNIFRVASHGPPVFQRIAGAAEGSGANVGTSTNVRDMFVAATPQLDIFEVEAGAGLTGPFLNDPPDNVFDASINGELVAPDLSNCTGPFNFASSVSSDPAEHFPSIGSLPSQITLAQESPGQLMFTGSSPWVEVTGSLSSDGSFTATGSGTVAGFSNIAVTLQGNVTPPCMLAGSYTMGASGGLPTGQPITYAMDGDLALQAGAPALTLALNKEAFGSGDTLNVNLTLANPGSATAADEYFGLLAPSNVGTDLCPNGDLTLLFTDAFTGSALTCLSDVPQGFEPLAQNVSIPAALSSLEISNFFLVPLSSGLPAGDYIFFHFLTSPNAFADGSVDGGDVLTLGADNMTFSP